MDVAAGARIVLYGSRMGCVQRFGTLLVDDVILMERLIWTGIGRFHGLVQAVGQSLRIWLAFPEAITCCSAAWRNFEPN